MTERLKNLALFVVVMVIVDLAAAQAYNRIVLRPPPEPVRTPSPVYHHDLRKNVDSRSRWGLASVPFRTNNLGFRDERVREVPLCSDGLRLLLIGDSFTEGIGVAFPETFAGILAKELRPQGVEVLNAGVVSYSPTIYYRKTRYLLEDLGLDVDMLIVFLDGSDIPDEAWLERYGRARVTLDEEGTRPPNGTRRRPPFEQFKHVLQQHSIIMKVAATLRLAVQERTHEKKRRVRLALDARGVAWDVDPEAYRDYGELGLHRAAAYMDSLLALSRAHELPMAVAVYPWPDHIYRRMLDSRQRTFWRSWSSRRGVPFFDLFPAFIGGRDPEATIREFYVPYDTHWNAAGHRRVARAVLEAGLTGFITETRSRWPEGRPSGSCPRSASSRPVTRPLEPAPR